VYSNSNVRIPSIPSAVPDLSESGVHTLIEAIADRAATDWVPCLQGTFLANHSACQLLLPAKGGAKMDSCMAASAVQMALALLSFIDYLRRAVSLQFDHGLVTLICFPLLRQHRSQNGFCPNFWLQLSTGSSLRSVPRRLTSCPTYPRWRRGLPASPVPSRNRSPSQKTTPRPNGTL
jgi:hypothetical protein